MEIREERKKDIDGRMEWSGIRKGESEDQPSMKRGFGEDEVKPEILPLGGFLDVCQAC